MEDELITLEELIDLGSDSIDDYLWYREGTKIHQSYIEGTDIKKYIQEFHKKLLEHINQKLQK